MRSMRGDFEIYLTERPMFGRPFGLKELIRLEKDAGMDFAVVMPAPTTHPDNFGLLKKLKDVKQFLPCPCINPNLGKDALVELQTLVKKHRVRAIKLQPTFHGYIVCDAVVNPVMEAAAKARLIVNIHSGTHGCTPSEIGLLADRFPDVPIIMDHMGHRWYVPEAVLVAKKWPNVYLGTTIANHEPCMIHDAWKQVGAEKIVFGSNAPGAFPDLCVAHIRRMGLPKKDEAAILGENLAKLYGVSREDFR
ncbi:MAG: hypothetical protein FJ279_01435 [Planctomycetes bacterium]|nr:hypothetical protein [Planctomycetota bacterium]MBM4078080.1 hypothetical protein [Planctomycetota bacterium]